jgi:hypothetical protein
MCEKDLFPAEKLNSYLEKAEQVMFEIDLTDQTALRKAGTRTLLPHNKTMADYLTPDDYKKVDLLFRDYAGVSFDAFKAVRPLYSSIVPLSSRKAMGCHPPIAYDIHLTQMAASRKIPILGLETIDIQFDAVDTIPIEVQVRLMQDLGNTPQRSIDELKELTRVYFLQDAEKLYEYVFKGMKKSGFPKVAIQKLLDDRNVSWIPRIEDSITKKQTFIAVGAGHLGGKNGVVRLLRKRGYAITPIKL